MRLGSCENHGTPGVRRTVRVRRTPFCKVSSQNPFADIQLIRGQIKRHSCGPAFCARIPRVHFASFSTVIQWNRAYNAILPVQCHCRNDAVTLFSLRPHLAHGSTDRRPRFGTRGRTSLRKIVRLA